MILHLDEIIFLLFTSCVTLYLMQAMGHAYVK